MVLRLRSRSPPILHRRTSSTRFLNQSFGQGPWMAEELMSQFFDELAPSTSARVPLPKDASSCNLEGMPPTLIMTAENDVARDGGEAYARKVMQAVVRVSAVRFLGTIHDFAVLDLLADTPAAQGAVSCSGIEKHFR
ncbi:alpha/beta hydrolase fold domain-containing protein [Rhizobium mesoamericanum]|uniref:Alpha/beta hydrolase fold-3 domain-containing protein n=1 Tax=Rhizobium mesoamericanum STM3625 TaxID=1211777 RepID=K0PZA0_9HYPH|nr:alpha/beta hydrolase fold domain-containing protein [Rhizobium mesoamericanum]CCM75329.1 hypothetical protein BN77_2471 [Rhizobium mesoamericanum STM3625]